MSKEPTIAGKTVSLIELFLEEQQQTAVEMFAEWHDENHVTPQTHYRDLIPLSTPTQGQQYAFEVDLDKCTGCKACVTACHNMNGLEVNETWRTVGLIHEESVWDYQPPRPTARITFKEFDYPSLPEPEPELPTCSPQLPFQQHVTTACHHCVEPGCLNGCPVKAYDKDPITGIVSHLDDQCIGCKYCILMCPYDVPQFNAKQGIVRKCNMCHDRLAVGEAPACVQSCPNQAIRITVVEQTTVKLTPQNYVTVPGAPDSSHTFPTTIYKTERNLSETMQPADLYHVEPWDAEYPLLFMLVFTQLAAGAFLLDVGLSSLLQLDSMAVISPWLTLMAVLFGGLGLQVAPLHLGRPLYAWRAFLGIRTSWLSREALAFGGFMGLAAAYTALHWLEYTALLDPYLPEFISWSALRLAVSPLLAVGAIAGIICSGMVYKATPRALWNEYHPVIKFSLTSLILGSATLLFVAPFVAIFETTLAITDFISTIGIAVGGLLIISTIAKLLYEAHLFTHTHDETVNTLKKATFLQRTRLLMATQSRFAAGLMGGILLPLALMGIDTMAGAIFFTTLIFTLTLGGELLARYLFFTCSLPPKMPGIPTGRSYHHE